MAKEKENDVADLGVEETDSDFYVDEEGFIVDSSVDEDEELEEEEQTEIEETEAEETEETGTEQTEKKKTPPKRKPTPAELKVIALKKENQELKKKLQEDANKQAKESLVAQYVERGHDEETAKRYAEQDIENKLIKEQLAVLKFERDNADVFAMYPEARERSQEIMEKAQAADLTAEQICRALFGDPKPDYEERAIRAAAGEYSRSVYAGATSSAERAALASIEKTLTKEERLFKRRLEQLFNEGKPISMEEFNKYRKE